MFIWAKTSENIEIEHVFRYKAFFNLRSYLHKICLGAFNRIVQNISQAENKVLPKLHLRFDKQLVSGLSPQSCLYFQGFWGSKLLNGCLVVWPSSRCLRGIQWFSGLKIDTYDKWFWNFPNNAFETDEFCCIVDLTAILRLQFLLLLSERGLIPES